MKHDHGWGWRCVSLGVIAREMGKRRKVVMRILQGIDTRDGAKKKGEGTEMVSRRASRLGRYRQRGGEGAGSGIE